MNCGKFSSPCGKRLRPPSPRGEGELPAITTFGRPFTWLNGSGFPSRWQRLILVGLALLLFQGGVSARAGPDHIRKVIHQYALTSANDFPQRDPQDWRLLGSNDGGATWTTLDTRQGEVFTARQQRKLYQIDNQTAYETYRLQIDRVRDPAPAISVQLAEIELMGLTEDDLRPMLVFTDILSARGDNPPAETVANLFDGRVETKWLDWSTNQLARDSWIQWHYSVPAETVVTNISQLLALRARAEDGFRVQIKAVVSGKVAAGNRTCLVDLTGGLSLSGVNGLAAASPGESALVTGVSGWNHNQVVIREGRATVLSPMPATNPRRIALEEPLSPGEELQWVEIEGALQYQQSLGGELSFDVQDGRQSMRVHLLGRESWQQLPPSGTRVAVRGIVQGAYNGEGEWVATTLWAAGWESLRFPNAPGNDGLAVAPPVPARLTPLTSTNLTTIEQIRRLNQEQLDSHQRVKIRGVITGLVGGFVQDETGGIEVDFRDRERRKLTELGSYIEVTGVTELSDAGNPMILAQQVTVLGRGKLPPPQRLSLSQLMGGSFDTQWIEEEGVVRSTDGSHLLIISGGQEMMATLDAAPAGMVNGLVDAEVRVRGVGVTAMDNQGRIQGIHLLIPSLEHVDVMVPPADPARLPVRKIGSLLGMNAPRDSYHRVKVTGVVTLVANQKIYLQDDTGSALAILKKDIVLNAQFGHARWLYWQTPSARPENEPGNLIHPGDRVQIVGFPAAFRYSPVLTEVMVNKLGTGESPKPVELTANGIEEGGLDASLVTLTGLLHGETTIGPNTVLAVEWQDRTLQILVPEKEGDLNIAVGSQLRVTGVCQVDPTPYPELGLGVGAVRIQTRSPADVVVLARPPWWTVGRALILLGGMAFVMVAASVWIKALRRQVDERTSQLSREIQLREQTERQRALDQERARIAKDLHDDLGANLTQIVFLSERVEVARHENQESTRWFNLIPATARRTIQSLDEIVWAINPRHDSVESLANYLGQFAQEHMTLAGVRCVLDIPMVLPSVPLSAEVRHNLLLTAREALQNIATHAAATEVHLTLKLQADGIRITINDNGKGFVLAAVAGDRNGLPNMRRRMQAIGGSLEIISQPGTGTKVCLYVPDESLHGRVIGHNGVSR